MNTFAKQILLLLTFVCSFNLNAQIITPDEAASIAFKFFNGNKRGLHKTFGNADIKLAYTSTTSNKPDFYIFNLKADKDSINSKSEERGFVIINAEDADNPILAFSTKNCFNSDSIPANVHYILSSYKHHCAMPIRKRNRASVKEMLTTTWMQRAPYNSEIPLLAPDYTDDYALSVGCSSIATSQIMKYFNYPTHGVGSNSFQMNWRSFGLITYSADFENTTYEWDKMLDDYSNGYTEEQRKAVATLIYHVTVAENTHYGQIIGNGSANNCGDAGIALTKYFGYDKGMTRRQRMFYDDETWFNLINDELEAKRPIIFQAQTPDGGGHAFVVHGYDADNDLYAINWGWEGYCDGYYSLAGYASPLPNYTTDASKAYSNEQEITIGIQPDAGGSYLPQIGSFGDYTLLDPTYGTTNSISIDRSMESDRQVSLRIRYMNYGIGSHAFDRGVKLYDNNTNQEYIIPISSGSVFEPDEYNTFSVPLTFSTSEIELDGSYQVLPIIRIDGGEWIDVLRNPAQVIPTIEIANSNISNSVVDNPYNINKVKIYTLNGVEVPTKPNGISIIRDANGNVIKTK